MDQAFIGSSNSVLACEQANDTKNCEVLFHHGGSGTISVLHTIEHEVLIVQAIIISHRRMSGKPCKLRGLTK
jgi:hypothetical protein